MTAFSKDLSETTVANSKKQLSDVVSLTEKEWHQLLVQWNDTKVDYPKDVCIHQLFEAQVERTPNAVAVVFEDEQLTYQELNQQANQLAYHLKSLGVGPGMFVAVCMNRSLEIIPTLLGILKAGGAYVPLEPSFPKARFQWILSSLNISCIVTQTAPLKTIHDLLPQLPALEHVICLDTPQQPESINREEIEELSAHQQIWMRSYLAQLPKQNLLTQASQDDLAYIIFTSGSTGTPKGVMVRHKPVINLIDWVNRTFDVNSSDRILFITSLCFDLSVYDVFGLLAAGGSIRVVSDGDVRNPERLLCILSDEPITFWDSAPAVLQQLVPFFPFMKSTEKKSQLRLVFLSGDWIPVKLPDLVRKTFPGVEVVALGGATEATVWSNYYRIGNVDPHWVSIPYGKPIQNAQYYILDFHLNPCPIGVPGELYISGDCLSSGYVNEPILTAERFIPNPFSNELDTCLYKTGDLARYLSDGNIEFLGRVDHQVKIRGFRIELGEIEATLNLHPNVQKTIVLAREDVPGNKRLVAYVVPNEVEVLAISEQSSQNSFGYNNKFNRKLLLELRRFVEERLPEYMVPSTFVLLEALPLTSNGKVDRRALPAPDTTRPELAETYVAPRNPVEEVLAEIWAEVLRLEQVGIHDNFFELGGDSILSIQIIAKAHQTGLQLTPRQMFQHPTLAELAVVVGTTAVQAEQGLVTSLISHCQSSEVESYIPSTFPAVRQGQMDFPLPIVVPAPEQRHLPFPLTDIQQAYWVGQSKAFELGNVRAHVYVEFESVGLDLERCNMALQRLIERHEMLRIVVLPDGQQQILDQVPTYEIEVLDQRGKDPQVVASQLESVRQRMSHQGPANDRWPLLEILAHCLEEQRVRLHISISLLVMDGRAALILSQEFLQLYQNVDACLAPINFSFRDYVLALNTLQDSEVYQRSLNYWKNRLSTLPPAPELPLAKNLVSVSNPQFVRRSARLEPQTWRRLKNRVAQAGLTPTVVLCTAYSDVLTDWSKIPHFTLNILFFNRLPLHPQVNNIVGNFSSTLLLEVNNTTKIPFEARAKRLQEQLWTELEHSHVSGVRVLREQNRMEGRTSRAAMPVVFASTLNLNSRGEETSSIPLPGKVVYSCLQTPQVLLDHQVYEQDGTLLFNWDAVEELFPEELLDDMFNAYCRLLHRLANEDDAWQKTVPQLIPTAQLQQRTIINATEAPVPAAMLHTLFAAQVPQRARQAAVISSNQTLTYEELYCRANQVAHRLRQLGARPNVLVAVVMEKGWEQVVAVLGVLLSGAAYLAIDPALPKERLWYLLEQSKVGLVLTQSWIDENLEWPDTFHRLCVDSENLDKVDDQPLDLVQRPEDLAYVIFTSGSTGLPKGVMINHRSAVNTICDINQRFVIGPEDQLLALSSLSFDLSVYDIFGTLAAGGTIIIPDASSVRDPVHWADLLVREKVTIWNSVPALMQMLVEYAADRPDIPPCPLRLVLLSGDWIPMALPDQIKALVKGVQVISLGGATEASIWSILYPIEDVDPAWKSIPYGKPMLNQRCYVLNKALEACPVWVIGSLYIGGVGLAKGYWQDEEKTNARFIEHPRTGERLYCTGDLGRYLPDGNIEFFGREDFQVKVQGYRIELGEIEAALLQHPAVRDAVATAVGERNDNKRLAAYVVVDQDGVLDINELRSFLAKKLPDYMVPSAFMLLDALPLTPNGKVDRKALPVPDLAIPERKKAFVVPRDPLELQLAQIWGNLLNTDSIGITDNFFDLGGHSLLAVRLMTKIQKMFKQELSLSTLLQGPTIEHLASVLRQQAGSVPESSLVKIQPAGSKPPFFCIHPVGGNVLCYVDLARHLGLEQPFYALQSPGLDGKREPYTQIEDMAAHYIEALRAIQPEGPYFLGGWSMGGIVAFEMAQQLHKQEQEVGSLVLLDSRLPVGKPNLDDATLLSYFVRDLGGQFAKNLAVSYDELRRLGPDKELHHILEQARKANILPPDVGLMQVQRLLEVFQANTRAMWNYIPEAYPNRVILLRSSEVFSPDFEDFGDPTWGWSEFASKQIEIYIVPGNHYTILTNPHVKFLAEHLKHCLN